MPMLSYEITLGTKVRFTVSLDRKNTHNDRVWVKGASAGLPVMEGIVVGLRTLQNGKMEYEGDPEGNFYGAPYFVQTSSFRAALVATHLYRKPVLVALEDLYPNN